MNTALPAGHIPSADPPWAGLGVAELWGLYFPAGLYSPSQCDLGEDVLTVAGGFWVLLYNANGQIN